MERVILAVGRGARARSCCCSCWRCACGSSTVRADLVFTLGRTGPDEVKGPGWVLVVPIIQRGIRVDLREQFIEIPSQTSITKDNAPIKVDFLIYWRIVDPFKSVVEVDNFNGALQGIATTTLRAVIGDILARRGRCPSASRSTRSCGPSSTR